MSIVTTSYLTAPDPAFAKRERVTFPGQASWADHESGRTCRECLFWTGCGQGTGYVAKWRTLKPRPCAKFRALMNGKVGAAVPHDAPACRYFEANPHPPPTNGK